MPVLIAAAGCFRSTTWNDRDDGEDGTSSIDDGDGPTEDGSDVPREEGMQEDSGADWPFEGGDEADAGGPCTPDMALVVSLGICVDKYEASRGDDGRAVSAHGAMPWTEVTWREADAACAAAGKRLCESEEWHGACGGPEGWALPYGEESRGDYCNCGPRETPPEPYPGAVPTGSFATCEGGYPGIFDMVGNVQEWTATYRSTPDAGSGYIRRGGSAYGGSHVCYSDWELEPPDSRLPTLGFRCCKAP